MNNKKRISKWEEKFIEGAKRCNLYESNVFPDWFIGVGKCDGCVLEGTWWHMICLARNILASPNTKQAAPEYYKPEWGFDDFDNEEVPYEYIDEE